MRTLEELQDLYQHELRPIIGKDRKILGRAARANRLGCLILIAGVAASLTLAPGMQLKLIGCFASVFLALSPHMYYSYSGKLPDDAYETLRRHYKGEIVPRIVAFLDPSFSYDPRGRIDHRTFNDSQLFPLQAIDCMCEDMVSGTIERVDFKFCELIAYHVEEPTDTPEALPEGLPDHLPLELLEQVKSGRVKTRPDFFAGLFLYAAFNKEIHGKTVVLPNKDRAVTDRLGREKREVDFYGQLVKLENPAFEEVFSVYSTSQQEARYIITPTIMEAILKLHHTTYKRMAGAAIHISFVGQNVYCAIRHRASGMLFLFDPSYGIKGDIEFEEIEYMYRLLSTIEVIIRDMNLNTRIWTKTWG